MSEIQTDTSSSVSLREYGRRRGVTLGAVQGAIANGRIEPAVRRDENGRPVGVDPELADSLWQTATDPAQAARRDKRKTDGEDYYTARSRREQLAADLAELELAQRLGHLVPASEAAAAFADVFRQVREGLIELFEQADALLSTSAQNAQIRSAFRRMGRDFLERVSTSLEKQRDKAPKSEALSTRRRRKMAQT